jgi:anti-sigma-K factor RskA
MDDVEEQILSYPHLSVEEQREIEAHVESNPEWAPLLRDVRSIEHLVGDGQADLPSDALLATYVTVQHLHLEAVPSRLQAAFADLEARIEEDEALRRNVDAARRRIQEAEAAVDPVSHFESLTDYTIDPEASPEPAADPEAAKAREATPSLLDVFLNLPVLLRRGAVVAVVLVGLYGGLYGVSSAVQSPLDRLAAVEVSSQVVDNYADTNLRSPVPESDTASVDEQYLEALSTLREARTSTLGLFPHYDQEALARTKQALNRVLERVERGSFLALEARFYLGKVSLAQEEVETARRHFKTVVKGEGRQADEAYDILKTLQQEYEVDGG